ncbi:MAG TPA: hypothetical protein VF686_02870 [Brevundimonas sp.]
MRKSVSGLAVFAAAGVLLCGCDAAAQDQSLSGAARDARIAELELQATRGQAVPLPANAAALDDALARRDYTALRSQMGASSSAEAELMLNWAKIAIFKGGSFSVSLIYTGDLWRMAEAMERAAGRDPTNAAALNQQARSLKKLSVMMGLHAEALLQVDAVRCVDSDAAMGMMAETHGALAPQWTFARSLPVEERAVLIRTASILESTIAPVREPDYRLCASGTGMSAMAAGTPRAIEDPATPGADVAVEIDPEDLVIDNGQWWAISPMARTLALTTAARNLEVPFEQVL